jgi:hypothetical protein
MNKLIAIPIMIMFLGACVSAPEIKYVDRPVRVEIMVPADIPEPPIINNPFLPINLLTPADINDPAKIAKYHVKSIYLLKNQNAKLQCALDVYRTITAPQCPITFRETD